LGAHDDDDARTQPAHLARTPVLFMGPEPSERQRLVSRWLNDLVPFPGEAYRQFVKDLVQANKLVRGELVVDGNLADPAQITCPVLVLAHTGDVLAPPESAEALLEVISSADRETVTVSGGTLGHVDIVVGLRGRASCGRSWPHGWRPAQERTGRKPSRAGRPRAHDQRLQVQGRDGSRLAMGADGDQIDGANRNRPLRCRPHPAAPAPPCRCCRNRNSRAGHRVYR
jgi:hypothetical protein